MKVAFLIHDLGQGGAEKVLVNLVNNLNKERFDITVICLFGGGVNEQFLNSNIKYKVIFSHEFRGNSRIMKIFSPKLLYKKCFDEEYDVIVSYLEGPCARIVSGCPQNIGGPKTKLVSWIHSEQKTRQNASASFRNFKEANACYNMFDEIVCVSQAIAEDFSSIFDLKKAPIVLYNTIESKHVLELSKEAVLERGVFAVEEKNIIGVGSLKAIKSFDRLIRIHKRLRDDGINVHTYILGKGPLKESLMALTKQLLVSDTVTFLGYQTNPYKYVAKSDLYVCSSLSEGFSTAATEALIVGTPVCTVDVPGMREMLGDNEYGIITLNDEKSLYNGIKELLIDDKKLKFYKEKADIRGKYFSTENTVRLVEDFFSSL